MPRITKAEKAINDQVSEAFKIHANQAQINVMDLSKVLNTGRDAAKAGESVDKAMIEAVAKYRQN